MTSGFLRALTGYHKHTAGQKACGSFRIFWPLVSISGVCQHIVCSRNRPKNESNLQMGPIFHSCLSHNRRFWGILSGPSSPPQRTQRDLAPAGRWPGGLLGGFRGQASAGRLQMSRGSTCCARHWFTPGGHHGVPRPTKMAGKIEKKVFWMPYTQQGVSGGSG